MAGTIKDLARETGLGLATISSYLNGGNVREHNREKIDAAIEKYDFHVNEVARGLKKNKSMTIGVVIPEMNNIFCAEIITSASDLLRQHGYAVITCDCRTDAKLEREAVEFLIKKRVDGIINMPVDAEGAHLVSFLRTEKPVVVIDRKIRGLDCDYVLVNNMDAVSNAVRRLLENGHTKIGLIGGPQSVYTAEERTLGYRLSLMNAGIIPEERLIAHCAYTIKDGRDSMMQLIRHNDDMTAVIAVNYETTVGAIIAINESGHRLRDDISVIGFDNIEFAKACYPMLEIVSQPTQEIAKQTVALMLKRLSGSNEPFRTVTLKTNMVNGKSVKNIRT